ncbi:hypothetical protein RR46_07992 [Papilio xuthus]|uniref:Uncharacterized protein n=1 Tax=Papilio xuthus TaxID=66420 RepID=A0A194QFB2_PAPXU|nr:hypothetical protein RR46_07992 [Papilio xuthus]
MAFLKGSPILTNINVMGATNYGNAMRRLGFMAQAGVKEITYRPCAVARACTAAGLTPRSAGCGCACSTPPSTGLDRPRMSPPTTTLVSHQNSAAHKHTVASVTSRHLYKQLITLKMYKRDGVGAGGENSRAFAGLRAMPPGRDVGTAACIFGICYKKVAEIFKMAEQFYTVVVSLCLIE